MNNTQSIELFKGIEEASNNGSMPLYLPENLINVYLESKDDLEKSTGKPVYFKDYLSIMNKIDPDAQVKRFTILTKSIYENENEEVGKPIKILPEPNAPSVWVALDPYLEKLSENGRKSTGQIEVENDEHLKFIVASYGTVYLNKPVSIIINNREITMQKGTELQVQATWNDNGAIKLTCYRNIDYNNPFDVLALDVSPYQHT